MLQRHSDSRCLPDELVLSTIGLNRSDSIALCCCDCPKGRYAEFIQAYMDWYAKKEAQLELVPGFRKLLENMHKDGKRLAIADRQKQRRDETRFNATGIEHLFECVQTAGHKFFKAQSRKASSDCRRIRHLRPKTW